MQLLIVAIRDSAVGAFMRPFYMASTGQAIRSFQDEVARKAEDNMMYNHPEDFELFQLGVFDDSDGSFQILKSPKSLATAKQLVLA